MAKPSAPLAAGGGFPARDRSLYHLTPDASGGQWDLSHLSREFDSPKGDLTESLIGRLNRWAETHPAFSGLRLREHPWDRLPEEILLLDGSPSRLPLTMETVRLARAHLARLGLSLPVRVINRREGLLARVARAPRKVLILSQAAQRSLFDHSLAQALASRGVVVVAGAITAPGGPLSNKKATYELLNGDLQGQGGARPSGDASRRLTAHYQAVGTDGERADETAGLILETVSRISREWGATAFFVKPQEGGGGRGVFRVNVFPEGFALPDLSRLGVSPDAPIPLPLPLDAGNKDHIQALSWLAHRFSLSSATARAYLRSPRLLRGISKASLRKAVIRPILEGCRAQLLRRLRDTAQPFDEARGKLADAIANYQQLFAVPYQPLVCDWIDFGLFSMRAHMRLGRRGPVLENLYARLFPIEFTDTSVGTVGVDSITNRSEGGMELNRYTPIAPPLANSAGGAEALAGRLQNAFHAFGRFVSLLPPPERERLPIRVEFDLSSINGLIVEGNADPVRAQCANTRWQRFSADCHAWLEDALSYYAWKSSVS